MNKLSEEIVRLGFSFFTLFLNFLLSVVSEPGWLRWELISKLMLSFTMRYKKRLVGMNPCLIKFIQLCKPCFSKCIPLKYPNRILATLLEKMKTPFSRSLQKIPLTKETHLMLTTSRNSSFTSRSLMAKMCKDGCTKQSSISGFGVLQLINRLTSPPFILKASPCSGIGGTTNSNVP